MSEAAAAAPRPESAVYIQFWADAFAHVLGQITGSAMPCAPLAQPPSDAPASEDSDLWILCTCSGAIRGEMSLRLPAAVALRLARIFMSEPASPDVSAEVPAEVSNEVQLTPEHSEAVIELLRQVAGLVASSLKSRWGETQLPLERAAGAPSWSASSSTWLRCGEQGPAALLIELHLSAALVAGLRPAEAAAAPASAASSASPLPASAAAATKVDGKLELLMDVELAVTLRFGGRQLPLREVLDLSPGTVVELDRNVQDPGDLLLDGRLVARGEVVVIDGNYGMRVTEVVATARPTA
jgi:flagellar motor switch protein FliN